MDGETWLQERDTFFHLSVDMLCIADMGGVFKQINKAWEKTLGHTIEELTAVPFLEFVHPDDYEATQKEMKRLERGEDVLDFRNRYRCRDGTYRWLSWKAHSQPERGLIYAVARDVTEAVRADEELAESERRFKTLADSAPVLIWMADANGAWIYSNQGWRDFTGWSEAESAAHRWDELLHPNDQERCLPLYRKGFTTRRPFTLEGRLRRADGEYRWMLLTGVPRSSGTDRNLGHIGTLVDITERKREEDRRLRKHVQHAQKLESLSLLSSGVAHDFSNLLMSILGHVDIALMQTSADSPVKNSINAIQEGATRAAELCRQLLTFAGKGKPEERPVAVNDVVTDMLRLLEVSIPRTTVLESDLASDVPPVLGDANQLGQVVMNLITNAAEAIGKEGGTVRVRTGTAEVSAEFLARECVVDDGLREGTYVFLDVVDTGSGMDVATLQRVFDPFFTTKFTGRGFGLAVVLGIVRSHRGTIHVDTMPGRGTTVRVLLPPTSRKAADERERRSLVKASIEPLNVLVVDDEEVVLEVTKGMLEKLGCQVLTARRGRDALALVRGKGNPFELAILDVDLEDERGPDVGARLLEERPELKLLFMSGESRGLPSKARADTAAPGRRHLLQKPFSSSQLVVAMKDALGAS